MLTVAEVLKHPLFVDARVVAGHTGLDRQVGWVHMASVPDAPRWLNGGELVLTTMINMPNDRDSQRRYVVEMAEKGVAALAITTGRYIDQIPGHLCEAADTYHFALIDIPFQARFVDIAKAINQHISQKSMDMVQQALDIHHRLTRLVLEGGTFQALADKLAELLHHSISLENERFEAIATRNIADVDEARRYTQRHGRTDPRLVQALRERGYLPDIETRLRPVHLPAMPDVGLEMERVLAPIVVHGEIYGYLWIIADAHNISDIDMLAIDSGATIAALMMLHQESIQSAEASLKGSLLSQLIQGDVTRDTILTDQSLRYGVDLRSSFRMLIIENDQASSASLVRLYRQINQLIGQRGWHAVAGQFAGQVVVLAEANQDINRITENLRTQLSGQNGTVPPVRIGVSGQQQGINGVRRAHQQCQDVLFIQRRLFPEAPVVNFERLGYLHALFHAGPESMASNPYVPILRRLLDEKQADLFHTLEAYLDTGGNGVMTADNLHIHRSTLNYRLTRISRVCDVDLQDSDTQMNLRVALKLMRLFEVDQ